MKRSKSKFANVPKFEAGGFMNFMNNNGNAMGQGMNSLGGMVPEKGMSAEESFNMQQYGGSALKNKQSADQLGGTVENVVGSMGPWGAAIAGVSKIAGKAFGPDAYGDYEDNGKGKTKEFFNRSFNMKEGVAGVMDTFKRPTADNIKSQLTLGLWGKSEREKDGERIKRDAAIMKDNNAITQNAKMGSLMSNSLPKFSAPAYGAKGMKFGDPIKPGPALNKAFTTNIAKPLPPLDKPRELNSVQKLNLRDKLNPKGKLAPWNDPSRKVSFIEDARKLYIDDAGNLKPRPTDGFKNGGKLKHKSKFNRN